MNEGPLQGMAPDETPHLFQPDQVVSPSSAVPAPTPVVSAPFPAAPAAPVVVSPEASPVPQANPSLNAPVSLPVLPQQPVVLPESSEPEEADAPDYAEEDSITWSASEFVANQKSSSWYALLGVAAVLVGFLVWLFTHDFFPTTVAVMGVVLLGIYAGRQPREETYVLDEDGLTIGDRHYSYGEFRAFSVVPDGAFLTIQLMPLKRFAIDVSIYVDPDDEDRIIDYLSERLPLEDAKPNLTDGLMRRIKF